MGDKICRAFTLYHDKIFVNALDEEIEPKLRKDYVVIGYFDWFDTYVWSMDEKDFRLSMLFEYNNNSNRKGTCFQSFQTVFGFRNDADSMTCSDEDFWKESERGYLRLILYLQVAQYNVSLFNDFEKNLKERLDAEQYVIYYTLDKNDYVICFRSNHYREIIDAINHLYDKVSESGNRIIYSYTNLLIAYKLFDCPDFMVLLPSGEEELIDSICIKTILNNVNIKWQTITKKIAGYCKMLSEVFYGGDAQKKHESKEIVGYEILGDNDCRFIARDVPMNSLLGLFKKEGLLNNSNKDFNYYFVSSMTSLNVGANRGVDFSGGIAYEYPYPERKMPNRSDLSVLEMKLKEKDARYVHLTTLLYQTYDYISFISRQTSEYEFNSIKDPFVLMLNLLKVAVDDYNEQLRPLDEFYEYLSSMYSNIQENMRTDIRFYGLSDFSVMSYYSPIKLRTFYSSVVNEIAGYYKSMCEKDRYIDYQFLFFLTSTPNTYVMQMWRNEYNKNKLMMVRVSESDFYEVSDLVFQLAHEAAHFVGNEEIRNREFRFMQIINFLLTRIFHEMKYFLKAEVNDLDIDPINTTRKVNKSTVQSLVDEALNCYPFSCYLSETQDVIRNRAIDFAETLVYYDQIKKPADLYFKSGMQENIGKFIDKKNFAKNMIRGYYNEISENIKKKMMILLKDGDLTIPVIKKITTLLKSFLQSINQYVEDYYKILISNSDSDYAYAINLMSETYADISAILLFNIDAESFCDIILKRMDLTRNYVDDMVFMRMCVALKVMADNNKKSKYINDSYQSFLSKIPGRWANKKELYRKITEACDTLENKEYCNHYVYLYASKCLSAQCDNLVDEKRNALIEIYSSINISDTMSIVKYLNQYLSKVDKKSLAETETDECSTRSTKF